MNICYHIIYYLYIMLLKREGIFYDCFIRSSTRPIFMISFSNESTWCADKPLKGKNQKS